MSTRRSWMRAAAVVTAALGMSLAPEGTLPGRGELGEVFRTNTAEAYYGTSRRVARRTSRRTASRYSAASSSVAVVAAPVGVAPITALPSGCVAAPVGGITYHRCGATYYRPYYQGTELVYVEEAPPAGP